MPSFDDVADELYAVLPAEFVAARTEAVAEAKRTDKGLARRIGELGKPTLAAWVVNLLVREAGDQVTELVELGDLLRRAQDDLDPDQLRALDKQRRQVVRALAREAGKLARRAGHPVSDQVLVQVEETLKASVADPAAAEVVLAGRLTGAVTYNGLGTPGTTSTTGRPPRRPAPGATRGEPTGPDGPDEPPPPVDLDAARAAKADRAARREAEEKLRAARTTLRTARTAVDDAVGELEQATTAAREAAQAASAARRAGDDARARVEELEAALAQARERADQADDDAATAQRGADAADADRTAAEADLQRAEADRDRAQQVVDELGR